MSALMGPPSWGQLPPALRVKGRHSRSEVELVNRQGTVVVRVLCWKCRWYIDGNWTPGEADALWREHEAPA